MSDDGFKDGFDHATSGSRDDSLKPLNAKPVPKRQTAVAIQTDEKDGTIPRITAAGRGHIAEQIIQAAFAAGIKVREDKDLAELLAQIELDSPVPPEAFLAVSEILAYIYRANGQTAPFDAILEDEETE